MAGIVATTGALRTAVREYAYACAEEEFERASYMRISGDDS